MCLGWVKKELSMVKLLDMSRSSQNVRFIKTVSLISTESLISIPTDLTSTSDSVVPVRNSPTHVSN